MFPHNRPLKGVPAPLDVQEAIRRIIADDGEPVATERLGVSAQTLARLGAGLPVNRASVELAKLRLGIEGGR